MTKVPVRQKRKQQRTGQKNQPNDAYEYASIVCFAGKVLNSDMTLFLRFKITRQSILSIQAKNSPC
ncbi:hypothetical protein L2V99_19940, partial [Escherichia coli]